MSYVTTLVVYQPVTAQGHSPQTVKRHKYRRYRNVALAHMSGVFIVLSSHSSMHDAEANKSCNPQVSSLRMIVLPRTT
jgi:hypothetical protein